MQPTYFASFLLGEDPATLPPAISEALEVIARWIFENPYRRLFRPEGWPDSISEPIAFPNGERVHVLRLTDDKELRTAAVRFEHSDQQSRLWRTDCVLTTTASPTPAVRFAVTVAAGSSGDGLYPVNAPSTRPRIVRSMIDRFGARETFPLKSTFLKIEAHEAESFVGFLLDPARTMPVVFVTRRNYDGSLVCNVSALSDRLVGIAYVCVANDSQLTWTLASHIDNRLNTYDGAVRVYWPRMATEDSPYRHRFWTRQQIFAIESASRSLADDLLGMIAAASVTRRISGLVRWEDVEREITRLALQRLQAGAPASSLVPQDFEDWLRKYQEDLTELDAVREKLADASEHLLEKEEEVRQWKQMYLQSLRAKVVLSYDAADDGALIQDARSAIDMAARDFEDELEIMDGRIEKETRQFEEPELLYGALKWLATIYRNARTGAERCADLDKSCRETCQFRYNSSQSEVTMGMYASDYEVTYGERRVKLKEHLGFGTSSEPRHTIRIAFFFDNATRKVVIGYIGQHQATRRSN